MTGSEQALVMVWTECVRAGQGITDVIALSLLKTDTYQ